MSTFFPNATHSSTETIEALCDRVRAAALRLKRRLPRHVDVDDLVGAGFLGLARALANWREGPEEAFRAYALRCATGAMLDELRSADQLTRGQRNLAATLGRTETRLSQALGRSPDGHELAEALGISEDELAVSRVKTQRFGRVSLGEGDSIFPLASAEPHPEATLETQQRTERLLSAIDGLPERLRTVLDLTCGEDLTLREIGSRLGVTEARVCQLRKEAVARLRASCRDTMLPSAA